MYDVWKKWIKKRGLNSFLKNEARSCSMDLGCVTPVIIFAKQ